MWENLTPVVFSLISDFRPLTSNLRLAVSPRPRVVSLYALCPMPYAALDILGTLGIRSYLSISGRI
jgi:hypothetical protein